MNIVPLWIHAARKLQLPVVSNIIMAKARVEIDWCHCDLLKWRLVMYRSAQIF
jgi:hypothetical protein